jgi:multicopper oxidase
MAFPLGRRDFLRAAGFVAAARPLSDLLLSLAGCTSDRQAHNAAGGTAHHSRVFKQTGPTRDLSIAAEVAEVDVAPRHPYGTWVYNGKFPGAEIRVQEGDRLHIVVDNRLSEGTTVHWHGVPVPNPMDGVPGLTQQPIKPGEQFVYDYVAAPSGIYIYHTHVGLQLDRRLMGPLIIEEKQPHIQYDRDYVMLLDDFLPGAPKPLTGGGMMGDSNGGMMGRMMAHGQEGAGESHAGMKGMQMPPYTALMINGRLPESPVVFDARKGERLRLRFLNASGASAYQVAIGGHRMAITHTDGRPVKPMKVDAFRIAMGERYDVLVEANDPGAWWIVAAPLEQKLPPLGRSSVTWILHKPYRHRIQFPRV